MRHSNSNTEAGPEEHKTYDCNHATNFHISNNNPHYQQEKKGIRMAMNLQFFSEKKASKGFDWQSAILLFIFFVDIVVVSHMVFVNFGNQKMYFMYGAKFYITYPNRPMTMAHGIFGVIPLILSLYQISHVARKNSPKTHRRIGMLLVICGGLQIPTTCWLGIQWPDQEVLDIMRVMFCVFAFLWGLWGFAVLYYIRWKKDMAMHRQWAVRFAVICHFVPIVGRLLVIPIWYLYAAPLDVEGRIVTLQTGIWTLVCIFLPFQEFWVWLETGSCWFHSHSIVDVSEQSENGDMESLAPSRHSNYSSCS